MSKTKKEFVAKDNKMFSPSFLSFLKKSNMKKIFNLQLNLIKTKLITIILKVFQIKKITHTKPLPTLFM